MTQVSRSSQSSEKYRVMTDINLLVEMGLERRFAPELWEGHRDPKAVTGETDVALHTATCLSHGEVLPAWRACIGLRESRRCRLGAGVFGRLLRAPAEQAGQRPAVVPVFGAAAKGSGGAARASLRVLAWAEGSRVVETCCRGWRRCGVGIRRRRLAASPAAVEDGPVLGTASWPGRACEPTGPGLDGGLPGGRAGWRGPLLAWRRGPSRCGAWRPWPGLAPATGRLVSDGEAVKHVQFEGYDENETGITDGRRQLGDHEGHQTG